MFSIEVTFEKFVNNYQLGNSLATLPACPPCPSSARELALVSARELRQAFYEVVTFDIS